MTEPRRASAAPWIAAAISGAVLLALVLVYFLVLRPDQRDADRKRTAARNGAGQLSPSEATAVNAAATEMLNLITFSRANFSADFKRALDGTTGALTSDVGKNKQNTLDAMNKGKFDLYGKLTHKALEGPVSSGKTPGYQVLVTLDGYHSTAPGQPVQQTLEVTVLQVKGKWLASDVTNIGISS